MDACKNEVSMWSERLCRRSRQTIVLSSNIGEGSQRCSDDRHGSTVRCLTASQPNCRARELPRSALQHATHIIKTYAHRT